jgi:hypothetical protein
LHNFANDDEPLQVAVTAGAAVVVVPAVLIVVRLVMSYTRCDTISRVSPELSRDYL